ncbi:tRNA (guanine-N2)-dimethyltransferase [Sulfurovum lithotrophicum]|uniref:tRNA (guanosine(18)-2'-O)-methyltransferase n=1 Tax=Sulfurovum lithotrophicum TaxID=206403 RepID=A0A7U4M0T8_9BACT|nr:RNA methyltransferase [Sulfurovum lithotrophicum]AKF24717.1 tRNA (guanine-N2)-dimethyltransferase [Sulfurovum lithotrophicum]
MKEECVRSNQDRIDRIDQILCHKQPVLKVMLDDVHSSQNLSAILRTCDAVGVQHLYYTTANNKDLRIHKTITQGAHRWVERIRIGTEEKIAFLQEKQKKGYQVVVTHLEERAVSFRKVDYTKPTIIVMGNEKEGVSSEIVSLADTVIIIPMQGMVQSLNVSVAAALILYEAERQLAEAGRNDTPQLSKEEREKIKSGWLYRDNIARRSKGKIPLK